MEGPAAADMVLLLVSIGQMDFASGQVLGKMEYLIAYDEPELICSWYGHDESRESANRKQSRGWLEAQC